MTIAIDPGTRRGKAGTLQQAGLPGSVGAQTALHEFTDRLYRSESEADVYDAALDAIRHALGCERASILLFDASDTMKFVAWRGSRTATGRLSKVIPRGRGTRRTRNRSASPTSTPPTLTIH